MPELLFKFKNTTTRKDVERVCDILSNNRLYFPKPSQLNDPLEGTGLSPVLSVAGSSISNANDEAHSIIKEYRDSFRILSLSENCFSPQLWAYYCNNYDGVCLCYNATKSFANATPIMYSSETNTYNFEKMEKDDIYKTLKKHFQIKQPDWKSEREWRIVEQTNDNYITYNPDELLCIIIGHNVSKETVKTLQNHIRTNVKILQTKPGIISRNINFLPLGYIPVYDGSSPTHISELNELEKYVNTITPTLKRGD